MTCDQKYLLAYTIIALAKKIGTFSRKKNHDAQILLKPF